MTRVYIAGPMTGLPDYNYPAFNAMASELLASGFEVENPAEGPELPTWSDYMRRAIGQLIRCDSVVMLPGWTRSKGACTEWFIATVLGLNIVYEQPPTRWMQRMVRVFFGRLSAPMPAMATSCHWVQVDDDNTPDTYHAACGVLLTFTEGGPKDNDLKFCHGCGRPVVEVRATVEGGVM